MKIIESISDIKYMFKDPPGAWVGGFSNQMIIHKSLNKPRIIETGRTLQTTRSKNSMLDEFLLDIPYSQEEMVQVNTLLDKVVKAYFSHRTLRDQLYRRISVTLRPLLEWKYIRFMRQGTYNEFRKLLENKLNIWLDRKTYPMGFVRCDSTQDYYSMFSTACNYKEKEIEGRLERGIGSSFYKIDRQEYSSAFIGVTIRFVRYFSKDIPVSQETLILSYLEYLESQLLISNRYYKSSRYLLPTQAAPLFSIIIRQTNLIDVED